MNEKKNTLVVMGDIPESTAHVTFAFKYECTKEETATLLIETQLLFNSLLVKSWLDTKMICQHTR